MIDGYRQESIGDNKIRQKIGSAVVKKWELPQEQSELADRLDDTEELKLETFVLDVFSNRMLRLFSFCSLIEIRY